MKRLSLSFLALAGIALAARGQDLAVPVRDIAFSPDGRYLAVGRGSFEQKLGDVTLWDVAERKVVFTHAAKRGLPSVAFTADGSLLALASYDNAAKLLEVPSGKLRAELAFPDSVRAVAISGDGQTLVVSCRDHKIHVWDIAAHQERYALSCKEIPRQVSIHPDGQSFLLIEPGGTAVIDIATGKPKFRLEQGANAHVYFAQHSADGRWIFTSDNHARVLVWHAKDGTARTTIRRAFAYNAFTFEPRSGWMGAATGWNRRPHLLRIRLDGPNADEKAKLQALLVQLDDDALEVREKASVGLLGMGFLAVDELEHASASSPSAEVRMRSR